VRVSEVPMPPLPIRAMLIKELGDVDIFTSLASLPPAAWSSEVPEFKATVAAVIFFRNSRLFGIRSNL